MFFDERDHVVIVRVPREIASSDLWRLQLNVDVVGLPSAPVESAMKVTPLVSVFGAVESANWIDRNVDTRGAFAGYVDLGSDEFGFVRDWVGWTVDSARTMVQMQVSADFFDIASAFAFEQVLAFGALLRNGSTRQHMFEAKGRLDRPVNRTRWEVLSVHSPFAANYEASIRRATALASGTGPTTRYRCLLDKAAVHMAGQSATTGWPD